jgi:hypothetical protein
MCALHEIGDVLQYVGQGGLHGESPTNDAYGLGPERDRYLIPRLCLRRISARRCVQAARSGSAWVRVPVSAGHV